MAIFIRTHMNNLGVEAGTRKGRKGLVGPWNFRALFIFMEGRIMAEKKGLPTKEDWQREGIRQVTAGLSLLKMTLAGISEPSFDTLKCAVETFVYTVLDSAIGLIGDGLEDINKNTFTGEGGAL